MKVILDLDQLRKKVLAAYRADDPTLKRFREYARRLRSEVRPLRTYAVNAVSFVSADGGDNRLRLDPAAVELIRVVDSRGNECVLDAKDRRGFVDDSYPGRFFSSRCSHLSYLGMLDHYRLE